MFLTIFARFSDMFGRKGTLCFSVTILTVFSLACGLARTMDQLREDPTPKRIVSFLS